MPSRTSRRDFLAAGVSAGLLAPLAGATPAIDVLTPQSGNAPSGSAVKLSYKTLGRTGLRVTSVGFGCMITSDPSVIERAADLGINYFDTARSYRTATTSAWSARRSAPNASRSSSPPKPTRPTKPA